MKLAGMPILLAIEVKMPSLRPELGLEPRTYGLMSGALAS